MRGSSHAVEQERARRRAPRMGEEDPDVAPGVGERVPESPEKVAEDVRIWLLDVRVVLKVFASMSIGQSRTITDILVKFVDGGARRGGQRNAVADRHLVVGPRRVARRPGGRVRTRGIGTEAHAVDDGARRNAGELWRRKRRACRCAGSHWPTCRNWRCPVRRHWGRGPPPTRDRRHGQEEERAQERDELSHVRGLLEGRGRSDRRRPGGVCPWGCGGGDLETIAVCGSTRRRST